MAFGIDQYTRLCIHGNVQDDYSNDGNTLLLIPFEKEDGFTDDVNTLLLIKGDGTDASTSFTDDSSYGHVVTANGNAQVDTGTQSAFGTGSAQFDGADDYLEVDNHPDFEFTGNFTIESFVYFGGSTITQNIFAHSTDVNNRMNIVISTTAVRLLVTVAGVDIIDANWTSLGLGAGIWYHFAIVRNGNNFDLYVDGTQRASTVVDASTIPAFSGNIIIGESNAFGNDFNGRLDNYRISDNARYTANFYPMARFKDHSTTNHGTKTTGAVAHYNTDLAFGEYCGSFPSGTYLTLADHNDWFFTTDFTIEFWVFWNSSSLQPFYNQYENTNRRAHFAVSPTTAQLDVRYGGTLLSNNWNTLGMTAGAKWYHIALVRSGTNYDLFVDGVKHSSTYTDADAWPDIAGDLSIGNTFGVAGLSLLTSRVDNYRISNTARYSANFTPRQMVPDSSTDDVKYPIPFGNCHVDANIKKFDTGSLRFDGSTDQILIPDSPDWFFTGDFTIDFQCRLVSTVTQILLGQRVDASNYWLLRVSNADIRFTFVSVGITIIDTIFTGGGVLNTTQFKHVAVQRSGNNYQCFIDGVQKGTTQVDSSAHINFAAQLSIGLMTGFTSFNGYLDELRISDVARYTGNFTPPDIEYGRQLYKVACVDEFVIDAPYRVACTDVFSVEGNLNTVACVDEFEINIRKTVQCVDEFAVTGNRRKIQTVDEFEVNAVYHGTSRSSTPPGIKRGAKGGQHRTDKTLKLKRGYNANV